MNWTPLNFLTNPTIGAAGFVGWLGDRWKVWHRPGDLESGVDSTCWAFYAHFYVKEGQKKNIINVYKRKIVLYLPSSHFVRWKKKGQPNRFPNHP